jgi:hypothetical protein
VKRWFTALPKIRFGDIEFQKIFVVGIPGGLLLGGEGFVIIGSI